jgi:type IX secretion system PorP/SprF family membrane protein
MKRIIFIISLIACIAEARSQQLPQYSNFVYNYLQYNPAVAGTAPCLDIKFGFRRQWTGIPDSPQTIFANAHGKVGGKKRTGNFHGIGVNIENDQAGPFAYSSLNALYAYHMRVSRKYTLSVGASLGFSQYRIDYSSMRLEDQAAEPLIVGAVNDFIFPIVNFGLWLYRDTKFYGISVRSIATREVDGIKEGGKLQSHWTFANGYAKKLGDDLTFKPAFLLNYVAKSKASLEFQGMMDYKEKFALGIGARSGHGFSALMKITALNYVSLAYAFDITANKLRYDGKNSHEIIIGIRACKSVNPLHVPCSAYD